MAKSNFTQYKIIIAYLLYEIEIKLNEKIIILSINNLFNIGGGLMKKILIAFDGSSQSYKAVRKGAELAKSLDLKVTLINVVPEVTINSAFDYYATLQTERLINRKGNYKNNYQKKMKKAKEIMDGKGIIAEIEMDFGNPADVLCDYAIENNFDLILIGDKGISSVKKFFLGSITDKVAHYSKISVLIVK